jgi:hypothetical protein
MYQSLWEFPEDLIARSREAMAPYGLKGHEGLALWFGSEADGVIRVTHLVLPFGEGLRTHPLRLDLSMPAMSRLTRLAGELDRYWLGQIHSHPGEMLDLSAVDKAFGIHVQDYLSLVCPFYAQRATTLVEECGVHLFDRGGYRRMRGIEIKQRIKTLACQVQVIPVEVAA